MVLMTSNGAGPAGIASHVRSSISFGAAVITVWFLSRIPGLLGFMLAQRAQGQPATWTQLAARWDGEWYLMLARDGYPPTLDLPGRPYYGPWGFFPFWPWTIRALSAALGDHPQLAAAVATALYGILLLAAVWIAALMIGGRQVALGTTVLFAFFPGSLALTMPYTEGAFIFWSIVAVVALGSDGQGFGRRLPWSGPSPWWGTALAAFAAFMACGTRSTGIAVLAAVALHAVLTAVRARRVPFGDLLIGGAGVVGVLVDFAYAGYRTGDPFIWRRAQAQWHQVFDWGHGLVVAFTQTVPNHGADYRAWTVMLVAGGVLLAALALAVPSWRRIPLTWWLYTVVLLALTLLWSSVGPRPRMLLALFPVFIAATTTILRARIVGWVLLGVAVAGCAVASVGYAYAVYYVPWHVTA